MLKMWKQKKGKVATYRKLTETFVSQGRRDVAEKVCEMCSSHDDHECVQTGCQHGQADIAEYGDHLRDVYLNTSEMRYSLNMDFLPSPTHTVFNLVMIGSKKVEYGTIVKEVLELVLKSEVEKIIDEKKEVKLEDIFKTEGLVGNSTRKFILFEGAPGAGKSTLACLICQRWGARELFQEFQLVILIRLNDPEVHSATSLADVLPFKSDFDTHKILSTLKSVRGRGVLFILDGWDEYAPQEKEISLLDKLIRSPSSLSLPLSAVIVTSRPVATGRLQTCCSLRIQIVGFKPQELKSYFQDALQNDHQAIVKLEQSLKEKPIVKKVCFIPLNAAIIAHTFQCMNGSLPATIYDTFRILVRLIVRRHIEKSGQRCAPALDEDFLTKLPHPFQDYFENLCRLAYTGVTMNKTTFSAEELKSHDVSNSSMLSLLHGAPSFVIGGQSVFYSFVHLTVQELLATLYILTLPLADQFEALKQLFCQPRFVAIFQFYTTSSQSKSEQHASEFCHFLSDIFKQIRSQVDRQSQRLPRKWQGDPQKLKDDPEALCSELQSVQPHSFPSALSSLDMCHVVLYCPLPYFDVGYVLVSASVSREMQLKFDCCACIQDDIMMYGHLSEAMEQYPSVSTPIIHGSSSQELPQHFYTPVDTLSRITEDLVSSPGFDNFVSSLPRWFSAIKDRLLLKTYVCPLCCSRCRNPPEFRLDISNILIVGNCTSEEEMKSISQECENLKEQCQLQ